MMEAQPGQEGDQCGTQKAMGSSSQRASGVAGYGMHDWKEALDKAVPMYLQIPADPSVMIIQSRQPVLG